MMVHKPLTLLCLPLLVASIAACGTTVSTSSYKGEQQKVAQAVSNLQSHATELEAKKICSEDLAAANIARLNTSPGGCKKALEIQLKQIDNFEASVESVQISGDTATAKVKVTNSGKKAVEALRLVREGGEWKVSGIS